MKYILPTNYYSDKPLQILKEVLPDEFHLISLTKPSKEELVEKVRNADYLLVGGRLPIDHEVLTAAVKLKMIQRTGVGLDSLDISAIKEKGIPVYVNSGVNARSVAEHTIMLILTVLRRLPVANDSVKSGKWLKHNHGMECSELFGKTVGLIGIGNIGQKVAKMLQVFGVTILYYDTQRLSIDDEKLLNIRFCSFLELLKEVDILSLHCPVNSQTKGMISKNEIEVMKTGSIIINTSRGGLIDDEAIVSGLNSGQLKGFGTDVYSKEPITADNPFLNMKNTVLTPHVAGITIESFRRMMSNAFENIKLFDEGKIALLENKKLHF